jgi:hypothetical protein
MARCNVTVRIVLETADASAGAQTVQEVLQNAIETGTEDGSRIVDFKLKRAACDGDKE